MARPRAQIDAALLADAFAADGLHGTTSRRLAAATGVAKPTLYAHGGSKEALFLRAVEAEVERVLDRLHAAERASAGRSARDRAEAAALALLDHASARPLGARLLAHTARHERSTVATSVDAALRRIVAHLETGLRRDLAADGLDPSAAPLLARAVHGCATSLAQPRAGERRATRAARAQIAARVVPEPPALTSAAWPAA